uniref:ATP synthase complex subunit 8 n=1 Tax=Uraeotyphlus cf. oxyurus MW-212 TaxID=262585 RepID=Q64JP1_9AMPH|nr:ATP synthase F0 subunit 8 [Uraeotyphlus cf. oxyurus MW-212]AAS13748.1 ATP synthase F0 subunit 8 [Uraeotyphlus cf. oxyurus MW-212]
MPQLYPAPWFMIFMLTWFIFLLVSLTKTTKHLPENNILPKSEKLSTTMWTWPWH